LIGWLDVADAVDECVEGADNVGDTAAAQAAADTQIARTVDGTLMDVPPV
jgi:hypothetical protein